MKRSLPRAILGLVLANAAAAVLVVVLLRLLAAAQPVDASGLAVENVLRVGLSVETGTGQPGVANNGQIVTYTIRLTNTGSAALNNVQVLDTLPLGNALTNIQCAGSWSCEHLFQSMIIPEPLGGSLLVTITRQLSWTVSAIAGNSTELLVFTSRVGGQADGTVINNIASVLKINGSSVSLGSSVNMTVRVPIENRGHAEISEAATWFSSDLGGTLSQDWGDLNRDGYIDLVLGSSVGTSAFINENGRLKKLAWNNTSPTYGVRWADFNGDGRLDIVAVGTSDNGQANTPGTNYIYGQLTDPATLSPTFAVSATFMSPYQLVRVGVGDFDGDRDVDIVASTNSINAPCPVLLYKNNGSGQFNTAPACISTTATAAIGPGDYDNDGDLDLALGLFPDTIAIFVNNGAGVFNQTAIVDDALPFLPYDFAWGDYTADGKLDLAAAFPLQKEARVFRNLKGAAFIERPFDTSPELVFRTASFLTPLAVDWGDFNGDGRLDLMVADEAPKVYLNQSGTGFFLASQVLASGTQLGQKWGLRGAQLDLGGDLSLAVTNRDRPSLLLEGFASHLASKLTRVNSIGAASVAWGDADNDNDLDLLLGAGSSSLDSLLYYNFGGTISSTALLDLASSGLGPHHVAFGDVDGNRRLDIAVATPGGVQLYQQNAAEAGWSANAASHVAFTDANSDGRLDLLAATSGGGISLYLNQGGVLNTVAAFSTPETGDVHSLAVADFNRDFYPDFAVAFDHAPAQVFLNNKNNTFTALWDTDTVSDTRSVAWGDYNIDGYVDLAVGNYQAGTQIYRNISGTLSTDPVWSSPTLSKTTALAWGDWDNDGYPDLAIGNDREPQQVFANLRSEPNLPRLYWLWSSDPGENWTTTGLAWGDVDGDGDLDLGYSQAGGFGGANGYYKNGTLTASHHVSQPDDYLRTMPLPNNPAYVGVPRPGDTSDAYLWSSSEVLALGNSPTVTIYYVQYDPDGARRTVPTTGDPLARTFFEFSLDGGSTWKRASGVTGAALPITTTSRTGVTGSFVWDARRDQAISDDARFRIRVVPQLMYGPVQRASTIGVSPPFRIRALAANCIWPDGPNFAVSPDPITPGVTSYFTGSLVAGTGPLTYTWKFSDQVTPTLGQVTTHQFIPSSSYSVTLTVTGPACPRTRPVVVTRNWGETVIGEGSQVYLPLIKTITTTTTVTTGVSAVSEPVVAASGATLTLAPTEAGTAPETAEADTGAEYTGSALTAGLIPQIGVGVSSSQGEPTLRTNSAARPALLGPAESVIFITTPDTIGISNEPSISANGKYIAFWSTANLAPTVGNPDGNIELFVAEKASPVKYTQVTSSTGSILGGFNLSPSMDESGTRVAFFSDRDLVGQNPESSFQVYLYDSTTASVTQVTTRTRGFNILPSLSGDGQYIAFVSDRNYGAETDGNSEAEGNSEIALAQLGAGGTLRITPVTTTTNQSNDEPRIDFDGNRIAFVSTADLVPGQNSDANREVFVATILPDGSVNYTQVTNTGLGTTGQVSISSDGNYVAFVSDQDPDADGPASPPCLCRAVYRVTLDGAGAVTDIVLASNNDTETGLSQPSLSADGTRIAYVSTGDEQMILHDVVSGVDSPIDVAANTLNPAISAGGTAVAFASEKRIMWAEFPLAELHISKTADPLVGYPGSPLRFTIVVSNSGPSLSTGIVLTDQLSSSSVAFGSSPDQLDNSSGAGGFGATGSTHNNTFWDTSPAPAALTINSGVSGTYTSRVMDAGSAAPWTQFAWTPNRPYGKPLPDNGLGESAYNAGNADLAGLAALLHLDEAGSTETYANTASTVAAPGKCRLDLNTCPQPGGAGPFNASVLFNGSPNHLDINVLPAGTEYAVSLWFKANCTDCGLFQIGRGELGNAARDRQVLLQGGAVCGVLNNETQCTAASYADGQWHHLVHTYGDPGFNGGVQKIYVDGTLQASGVVSTSTVLSDAVINVGYATGALSQHFNGNLDELAVFGRELPASQVLDLYLRGAAQLLFQVRTCAVADCSDGGAFVGPGGISTTFYSEASNVDVDLPDLALDGLPVQRYFQYQVTLNTGNAALHQPRLHAVQVGPSHGAVESHQGFCALPVAGQPIVCNLNDLDVGEAATVTVNLTPTTYGELTNTALVTSDVEEHDPVNVASVTPNILPLPIEVFTLNLAGVPGLAGTGHTFTASVGPITASTPISYFWQATNQTSFVRTGGLTNTAVITWFTGGPQVVTVTAMNAANVLSGTPGLTATLALTVSNPVPVLTSRSPSNAPIDSGPVTLVLTGSQFVGTSQVRWAGAQTLSSTVASSTRITATIPANLLNTAGNFTVTVVNPTPGGGTSQPLSVTVSHPAPQDLVLNPTTVFAGGQAFSLTITGTDIYSGAQVLWNGTGRPTQVNTATQTITAAITAADISTVGTTSITVVNPSPNTGASAEHPFTRTAVILDLKPDTLTFGLGNQIVMTASIPAGAVQAGNRTITLTSSSPSRLSVPSTVTLLANTTQVTFTATSTSRGGTITVTATLPASIGGDQDQSVLTTVNPTPTITGTNPVSATAGGITLTNFLIFGTNFVEGMDVYWDGTLLSASDPANGVITVTVPASLIALTDTVAITAVNNTPNTGASAPFNFVIGLPTLTLAPASATTAVNTSVLMTATTNTPRFQPTVITLTSSSPTVASVPSTVTIPANEASVTFMLSAGALGGSANITATLPAAYGLISATSSITVNNSAPVITSLSPAVVTATTGVFTLTINGSGFVNNSEVLSNGVAFPNNQVTFISANQLRLVNNGLIANAGIFSFTVHNNPPPSGGQTSNSMTLTVRNTAPTISQVSPTSRIVGGPDFTLTVTGTNFVNGAQIYFGGQPHAATMVVPGTRLSTTIDSSEIDTIETVAITVTNPAPTNLSPSSVPFTITQLGLTLAPTSTFTLTAGSSAQMTVTLGAVQAAATVITTTVSQDNRVTMPVTVTVPAGTLQTSFTVTATNAATVTLEAALPANLGGATSQTTLVILESPLVGLAAFNSGPGELEFPSVNLNFTATLTSGSNVTYDWSFGDGTTGSGSPTSHTYVSPVGRFYTAVVTATNSSGQLTATTLVQLNNYTPTLSAIGPLTIAVNSPATTLFLTGTRFVTGTVVNINGVPRAGNTNPLNPTAMTVTLSAGDLDSAGTYTVTVTGPTPPTPGRTSTPARSFHVVALSATNTGPVDRGNPVTLTALLTPSLPISYTWLAGDGSPPVTGGASLVYTYPTNIGGVYTAVVTASVGMNAPFTASTIVTINNLTPTITSIWPLTRSNGSNFTITITGTNIVTGSQIEWDGEPSLITPSLITQLGGTNAVMTATVNGGTYIPSTGTYLVRVMAPAPPGPPDTLRRKSLPAVFIRE